MSHFPSARDTAKAFKANVRMATTANITLSGVQNLDGVTAAAGDRVLVKDQSTASENGIYLQASGAWTRAVDADQNDEVRAGLLTFVSEGTAAGNKFYMLTTDDPIVVGSTSLVFSSLSGGGGGTPGGSNTHIQFNNAGAFGGDAGFTYDSAANALAFTKSVDGNASFTLQNTNGGAAATALLLMANDAGRGAIIGSYSSGAVTSGLQEAGAGILYSNTIATGLNIYTTSAVPIKMGQASAESFRLTGTEVIVNELGADIDFRVESDTQTHALFVDAGADSGFGRIGFFNSSPAFTFDLLKTQDSTTHAAFRNASTGASARAAVIVENSNADAYFLITSTGYSGSGMLNASTAAIIADSTATGGISIYTSVSGGPVRIGQGGNERISFNAASVVVNDNGDDADFRVEGDTEQNLLFVDAGAERIGFGTATPSARVDSQYAVNGANTLRVHNSSSGSGAYSELQVNNGSTSGSFYLSSTAYTTNGLIDADRVMVVSQASNGFLLYANASTAPIIFAQGGFAAANERFRISDTEVSVNGGHSDINFRVEGDTNVNLIFADAGTDRVGFGTNTPAYFADIRGALVAQMAVEARTAATSPAASDSRKAYTNEGATSQVAVTLPAAAAGLEYTFIIQDTDGIQITAAAGDTIRQAASVSASGGTATSTTIGDTLTLLAINSTEWIAIASHGTWTLA